MKKLKKQKGITLVALIITIVVLLILAVVAIGAVTDSNIIKYAQKAENDYTIAQEKEQIGVAVSSYQIEKTITGDTETLFYDTVKEELKKCADVTPNEDKTLTVTFNKTGNVYTVDKNGNITSNQNNGNEDNKEDYTSIGDFEITVTQTPNGDPVESVTLYINPRIPESWNYKEYTEDQEDEAAQAAGTYMRLKNSDDSEISNLKELIIAVVNEEYGDVLVSTLGKTFSRNEYDTMIPIMQSMVSGVDISTPQKAFEYIMVEMDEEYKTVQEYASSIYVAYQPTIYSVKIRKSDGEWKKITNETNWRSATYQVEVNGTYEIKMELDDKNSSTKVDVTACSNLGKYVKYDANGNGTVEDEKILWRVLRDDSDKVELITADVLGTGEDGIEPLDLTSTDFNDARNKYNNAVSTIVQKCRDITGISSVRSVGGPATDTTTQTVVFKDLTRFEPLEGENFSQYEATKENPENGFKVGDDNYEDDNKQMWKAKVAKADNLQKYWVASRWILETEMDLKFYLRTSNENGLISATCQLCRVLNYDKTELGKGEAAGVRPVLTLEAGVLDNITHSGEKGDPIEIYQNK